MINILIEGYEHMPSYDLTVRDFHRFEKYISIQVRAKLTREIKTQDLLWCNVLLSVRGNNPLSVYVARIAKSAGRNLVLLLDDDLMLYKSSNSYNDKVFANSLREIMSLSDRVITTSRYLGEKYKREYGISYIYLDTPVEPSQIKEKKTGDADRPTRILYAAGPKHKLFFDSLVSPILSRLGECYGDKVSLTVIGPDIETASSSMAIEKIASMPMAKYREYMRTHDFDIGLAPLFDEEFCRSKYFNKYIEYSMYGICGVYSDVLPYKEVVVNEKNGLLSANTSEAWYSRICQAIDDRQLVERCVEGAKKQMLTDFDLEQIANKMYDDMCGLISLSTASEKKKIHSCSFFMYYYYAIKRLLCDILRVG